jgi:hypothetical protein
MRTGLALLLLSGAAAAQASTGDPPNIRSHGPAYSVAAISRLDVLGLHLGMEQRAACDQLLAMGFRRQGRDDCGPHQDLDADDGFLPPASGLREERGRGLSAESVSHVSLRYEQSGSSQSVVVIYVDTDERNRPRSLTEATLAAWGTPTYAGYYAEDYVQFFWATSRRQALPDNRDRFGRCTYMPQCEWQNGLNCGPVFRAFATPVAEVVVYDWGRHIEIMDFGADLRRLSRSGDMRRRPWESPGYVCPTPGFID